MNTNESKLNFTELFKQITPSEINDDVFTLTGEIFPVITAGNVENYNSMIASGGGMGVAFKKPVTWCIFQSSRYTLELIEKGNGYTLSYFPDEYKEKAMFFGSETGKNGNKMKEHELTGIEMPSGNMSFLEARLIIECKLTQITMPKIDDFYSPEAKSYLSEVYKDEAERRKYVFGEITHVWVKLNKGELE